MLTPHQAPVLWSRASAPSALARDADLLRDDAAAMAPSPTLLIDDPIVSAIADDSRRNAKVQRDRPTAVAEYPLLCILRSIFHRITDGSDQRSRSLAPSARLEKFRAPAGREDARPFSSPSAPETMCAGKLRCSRSPSDKLRAKAERICW
jgi:hypothetical protein